MSSESIELSDRKDQPAVVENENSKSELQHAGLPRELLLDIFEHITNTLVNSETEILALLYALCLVSRECSTIARRYVYRRVVLTSPRAALSFITTLETSTYGELVQELLVWTSVYEYRGAAGRGGKRWHSQFSSTSIPGDRLMDTIVQKCPHLWHFTMQNRSTNVRKSIFLPRPTGFAVDIFGGMRKMELDARHSKYGKGFWMVEAASAGNLEFPRLEDLRLCCRGSQILSDKWARLPLLRRLVIADIAAHHYPSLQALLNSAPALEDLRLYRLPDEGDVALILPSTIKRIALWDTPFSIPQLPAFLTPCASSLLDLELNLSFTTGEEPKWPAFKSLRSLKMTWWCVSDWSLALLSSVLPTLRTLEIASGSEDEATLGPAATSILDLLSDTRHRNLEKILVMGNAFLEVNRLAHVLQSMPHLHTFGIGMEVEWLLSLLVQLPVDLKRLDLLVAGEEHKSQNFLVNILPFGFLKTTSLQTVCIVIHVSTVHDAARRSTIAQFRSAIEDVKSPEIIFEVQDEIDAALWTFDSTPYEDQLGVWNAIRKRWRTRPSGGPLWRVIKFIGRVLFWVVLSPVVAILTIFYLLKALGECIVQKPGKSAVWIIGMGVLMVLIFVVPAVVEHDR